MGKLTCFILLILIALPGFSQTVSVNNTNNASDLVDLLVGTSCLESTNISFSSNQAVASFNNNNGGFPLDEGVIIRTGNAINSAGNYTGNNLSSQLNNNSDPYLENLNIQNGQNPSIMDVAYLEFDFVPISNRVIFDFLFASNEYGEWQCLSTDAVAFVLTNLSTGQTTNMAVIPGTSNSVSARSVKKQIYNTACNSQNPTYFDTYNVDNAASTINMRGYTSVMNASATVTPGENYQIRFVIGDGYDADYDSAVFLKANSFISEFSLGADKLICQGDSITLTTGLNSNQYTHEWRRNGNIISNETGSSITTSQEGNYTATITTPGNNCTLTDTINISTFAVNTPSDIVVCDEGENYTINLNDKISEIVGSQDSSQFEISFFNSFQNAQNDVSLITNPTTFNLNNGFTSKTIWVRSESTTATGCNQIESFTITESALPPVDTLTDVVECSQYTLPQLTNGNYFLSNGQALNAGDIIQNSTQIIIKSGPNQNGCENQSSFNIKFIDEYNISTFSCGTYTVPNLEGGYFYTSLDGSGTLIPAGTVLTSDQTIYYNAEVNGVTCRSEQINVEVPPLPPVDNLNDVVVCGSYTLPNLSDGDYFTQPNGGGTQLNEGQTLTTSQTVYIFADDGTCSNQNVFLVKIIPDFQDIEACGSYELPTLQSGSRYYSQPMGSGPQIPENTVLTNSQTVYVYTLNATTQPNCTNNLSFDVTVKPIPPVDSLNDVELKCPTDFYELPSLTDGFYFTAPNRGGNQLNAGDSISTTQTIYINSELNGCQNETSFTVQENLLPELENYTDVLSCDPYQLPSPLNGKLYTEPGGNGTLLENGEIIYTDQTIYVYNYAEGENVDCSNETSFFVDILGVQLDDFEDINTCDNYTLPPLNAGSYFTESGGQGNALQAGDVIDSTQTIYVYAINGDRFVCESEKSFEVTISKTPELPSYENIENCGPFTLPALPNEGYEVNYYLENNEEEVISPENYTFSTPGNYTIYVYTHAAENEDCFDQAQFELTIYPVPELTIEGGTICFDPETGEAINPLLLESGADPADFEVNWYLNDELVHTGNNYNVEEPGEYIVKTTKLTPEANGECNYSETTVEVKGASKPLIDVVVSEDFANNANVEVSATGYGDHIYQLDDKSFQNSNTFNNVSSGIHTVTVKGISGECGSTTKEFLVLKYPKFFTPNNDGQNDFWNIKDLRSLPLSDTEITIYNQFGKLMKVISPRNRGWDGYYNGAKMPSDDYWFRVTYKIDGEMREFVSHFTLIR